MKNQFNRKGAEDAEKEKKPSLRSLILCGEVYKKGGDEYAKHQTGSH